MTRILHEGTIKPVHEALYTVECNHCDTLFVFDMMKDVNAHDLVECPKCGIYVDLTKVEIDDYDPEYDYESEYDDTDDDDLDEDCGLCPAEVVKTSLKEIFDPKNADEVIAVLQVVTMDCGKEFVSEIFTKDCRGEELAFLLELR